MSKFINYEQALFGSVLGFVTRVNYLVRFLLRIDKHVVFSTNKFVVKHRTALKHDRCGETRSKAYMYYIRLGKLSLSDCDWNYLLFEQLVYTCNKADEFIFKRQLVKFTRCGLIYEDEEYDDNTYYEALYAFQYEPNKCRCH